MNRRGFLGFGLAAMGGVFVPQFGQWYRRGSGVITAGLTSDGVVELESFGPAFDVVSLDKDGFTLAVHGNGKIKYTYRTGLFTPSLTAPVMLDAPRIVAYAV